MFTVLCCGNQLDANFQGRNQGHPRTISDIIYYNVWVNFQFLHTLTHMLPVVFEGHLDAAPVWQTKEGKGDSETFSEMSFKEARHRLPGIWQLAVWQLGTTKLNGEGCTFSLLTADF